MWESLPDTIEMFVEAFESASVSPRILYLSPCIRKDRTKVRFDRDVVAELICKLINSSLACVGPDAQNIRKVRDLHGRHAAFPRSSTDQIVVTTTVLGLCRDSARGQACRSYAFPDSLAV
jgi:hypothetical protein